MTVEATYVFLAGYGNSGDGHWQRAWHERLPGSVWVEHADWERAGRDEWVADVQKALWNVSGPMVVVAHSLGCLLLAEWCRNHEDPSLIGAFLAVPIAASLEIAMQRLQAREEPVAQDPSSIDTENDSDEEETGGATELKKALSD